MNNHEADRFHSVFAQENPPSLPSMNDQQQQKVVWSFKFKGNHTEYFKIWLSNIFLTIITLTLYAPWAKVRRLQYFYGNTLLNQQRFNFTAIPTRILIGRIIALVLLFLMYYFRDHSAFIHSLLLLLFFISIPLIMRLSLRFYARNSKYMNARFYFSASIKQTYWVVFCCAMVTILSLGILSPLALYMFKRYQINHLQVGKFKFKFNTPATRFFTAIIFPIVFMLLFVILFIVVIGVSGDSLKGMMSFIFIFGIFAYYFLNLFAYALIQGNIFKATWHDVQFGENRIDASRFNPWRFARIEMVNKLAILFSFGLLHPWAAIRVYKYKIESLQVEFNDNPENFVSLVQKDQGNIAEEIADIFDIDIAI